MEQLDKLLNEHLQAGRFPFSPQLRHLLKKWVREKVETVLVRVDPFPHLVIDDFLPAELYAHVLALWPPEQVFAPKNFAKRQQLNIATMMLELPPEIQAFWQEMLSLAESVNTILHQKLTPWFNRKFYPLFGDQWREIVREFRISFRELHLAEYSGVAGLHPHVDSVRLSVNSFLYASESIASEPALATVLYRSFGFMTSENNFKPPKEWYQKYLKPDVIVPYTANRLLSFVNTPYAFHGVEEFDIGARKRRLLLFSPPTTQSVEAIERKFSERPARLFDQT